MASARFVVNLALQKLGVLGAGREARTAEAADALAALQSLYGTWITSGAFGRLQDVVPTGSTYTAGGGGERIIRTGPELEVMLPEFVSEERYGDYGFQRRGYYGTVITVQTTPDGSVAIDVQASQPIGYVEPPKDGAAVVITDRQGGQTATWLYDGSIKAWQGLDRLTLDDEAPRSTADPHGLAALLAIEIADAYGAAATIGGATQMQAARYKQAMVAKFGMRREPVPGVYF